MQAHRQKDIKAAKQKKKQRGSQFRRDVLNLDLNREILPAFWISFIKQLDNYMYVNAVFDFCADGETYPHDAR